MDLALDQLVAEDIRKTMPRFQEPNCSRNFELLGAFRGLAEEAGCTPAQLALAWLLQKAPHIHVIPGTTSLTHLEENCGAGDVELTDHLVTQLEELINGLTVSGARYPVTTQSEIDTEEVGP